ncbi:hypothetical protein D9613_010522 [Agrocybe pediades]|uniref:Uncharacterized protein n=1 Tax=Agrocybe pediades TaxID=84607 RepID=A0A8H4VJD2_9AGAR|nr:hypothetical protein D9613_010522 [Agrocybe pediades]
MPGTRVFRFIAIQALLATTFQLGHAAPAATSTYTLYAVSVPPIRSQIAQEKNLSALESSVFLQATYTGQLVSESFSAISTASDGATEYLVQEFRTAELVDGPSTTFTQPAPTLTAPYVYASHRHNHFPATTMDHDWIAAEADQNCTFDLGRNEGVCTWVFLNPVPTVPPSSDPSAAVFATQTSTTVFTGSLVPIATVTAVSSAETGTTIRANILASVMAPFAIILLAVYAY